MRSNSSTARAIAGAAMMALVTAGTAACLDEPGTVAVDRVAPPPAPAEEKVDVITVENKTDVAIGVHVTYKGPDGSTVIVSSFIGKGGAVQIAGAGGKLQFVDLKISGGGTTYKKEDGGTKKKDGQQWRMWAIVGSGNNFASDISQEMGAACELFPVTPSEDLGDPLETVYFDGCSPCFGCPDPEPVPLPDGAS
ncbi:MAG: hypothetical protein E6J90_30395 [Deltaproteobacteria bacterium]|nr:MAG: hypothetical protein E6J90_30395 [Deltaproteobacteria bacterium]TMQ19909.1 MAG: hypothetical protein E6J91_05040 [Deltaproteobacteria bacterium]